MPQHVTVRPVAVADAGAIARVHVESSTDAYAPLAKTRPTQDVDERARKWKQWLPLSIGEPDRAYLVAEIDGEIVGFIGAGPPRRDDRDADVEVYVVHVLPAHRGRGVGGRLWTDACRIVRGTQLRSMYVETFAELRCCSFYDARGGVAVEREPELYYGGAVTRVVYAWANGQSCELAASAKK